MSILPRIARTGLRALTLVVLLTPLARADIEFVGLLTVSSRTSFILKESADAPPAWRSLGGQFAGYTLESFNAKEDALTLTKPGATLRLRLKDAKVLPGRVELNGTIKLKVGAAKVDAHRLVLPFGATTRLPAAEGVVWHITPTIHTDGNWLFHFEIERTGADGKSERLGAPRLTALPNQPFALAIGELEIAFAPTNP